MFLISQLLWSRFRGNFLVSLLGAWEDVGQGNYAHTQPISGLCYYLTPPQTFAQMAADPLHAILYCFFILTTCALFSRLWILVSQQSSRDIAKTLHKQQMVIQGRRSDERDMAEYLDRYIPVAAAFGGFCIGALTIVADILGVYGTGTGILLAVTTIQGIYESFLKEKMEGNFGSSILG